MVQLDDVTGPNYLDGLQTWSLAEVRARRDEATEVETGLSYLRRMVQGRLDIVLAEQHRRQTGEGSGDVAELVDRLPAILGDHVHAPGIGRLPALMGPGQVDAGLAGRLEEILPAARLGSLPDMSDADLAAAAAGLDQIERSVSSQRRAVFDVLDRMQEEIVRRYRSGEATVDSLLP
ncbi:MAG: aerial mycelium formation protein [Acidimicrobiales bacterium]